MSSRLINDLTSWEQGELSLEALSARHQDADPAGTIALHHTFTQMTAHDVAPPTDQQVGALLVRLPERAVRGGVLSALQTSTSRRIVALLTSVLMSGGVAYAAGYTPVKERVDSVLRGITSLFDGSKGDGDRKGSNDGPSGERPGVGASPDNETTPSGAEPGQHDGSPGTNPSGDDSPDGEDDETGDDTTSGDHEGDGGTGGDEVDDTKPDPDDGDEVDAPDEVDEPDEVDDTTDDSGGDTDGDTDEDDDISEDNGGGTDDEADDPPGGDDDLPGLRMSEWSETR